jgi:pyridoxine 4-dehydrogenase
MAKLDARKSGAFKIGGDTEIHRLGFGAMRITGKGIWGPPEDRPETLRILKRVPELGIVHRHRRLLGRMYRKS